MLFPGATFFISPVHHRNLAPPHGGKVARAADGGRAWSRQCTETDRDSECSFPERLFSPSRRITGSLHCPREEQHRSRQRARRLVGGRRRLGTCLPGYFRRRHCSALHAVRSPPSALSRAPGLAGARSRGVPVSPGPSLRPPLVLQERGLSWRRQVLIPGATFFLAPVHHRIPTLPHGGTAVRAAARRSSLVQAVHEHG